MIFVTVGTNLELSFDRLIRPMDQLAATLGEQVIIQRGCSTYEPQHAEHFAFTSSQEIEKLNEEARLLVSHAAAGAIIVALRYDKPLVVIPRLQRYNEGIDDHQMELAAALDEQGRAVAVYEPTPSALRAALEKAARQPVDARKPPRLLRALRRQLDEWDTTGAERTGWLKQER